MADALPKEDIIEEDDEEEEDEKSEAKKFPRVRQLMTPEYELVSSVDYTIIWIASFDHSSRSHSALTVPESHFGKH